MKKLKVTLHITQHCNYHCRYCFAQFREKQDLPTAAWHRIIDNIEASGLVDSINFAGGEPVLYKGFSDLVDYAWQKGFHLSIISNGSMLLDEQRMPPQLFQKFEMLGISVDSLKPATLRSLGCCDPQGRVLDMERLRRLIQTAKRENPKLRIKLNTVVTNLNMNEQLSSSGATLPIERWKFLKMKLFEEGTFSNRELMISDEAFARFLQQNPVKGEAAVTEYSLERSYIIIDNRGNLSDSGNDDCTVIGSLLEEPFSDVFHRYAFDRDAYESRYPLHAAV